MAATAMTGTRKFSVNSSLRASSSAMNPMVNASAASSWLPGLLLDHQIGQHADTDVDAAEETGRAQRQQRPVQPVVALARPAGRRPPRSRGSSREPLGALTSRDPPEGSLICLTRRIAARPGGEVKEGHTFPVPGGANSMLPGGTDLRHTTARVAVGERRIARSVCVAIAASPVGWGGPGRVDRATAGSIHRVPPAGRRRGRRSWAPCRRSATRSRRRRGGPRR